MVRSNDTNIGHIPETFEFDISAVIPYLRYLIRHSKFKIMYGHFSRQILELDL